MTVSYKEQWPDIKAVIRKRVKCDRKKLNQRVPILEWLPNYSKKFVLNDIIAGITVALTAIPQGIAYAVIAGLPPQYGLYAEMIPGLMYMIFGSCYYITIGPTAIMALLIHPTSTKSGDFAILGSFLVGIIIILFGMFNLGFLVEFISIPVTVGFVTAAALTIASSQAKSLFGIPGKSNSFLEYWQNVFENATGYNKWDTILGLSTVVILIALKKVGGVRRWKTFFKYLSLSRNALVVFLGTLMAFILHKNTGEEPFTLTGPVKGGFPSVKLPPFSTVVNNQTLEFEDMAEEFGASLITIPIIAILEVFAVAKAFAKGKTIDATQEMLALGLCNFIGSFFGSMPVTGSFSRTALNYASGVNTQLGGIFTVILVASALSLLTGAFYYIPKAVLAGVIICAVLSMIEFGAIKELWKTKRIDMLPFAVTLFTSLFWGIDYGILIGIAFNLLFILYNSARPNIISELKTLGERRIILITPEQSLYFSAAEYLKFKVKKAVTMYGASSTILVINGTHIKTIDSTTAASLKSLVRDLGDQSKKVILWNWNTQPIGVLMRSSPELEGILKQSDNIENVLNEQFTA